LKISSVMCVPRTGVRRSVRPTTTGIFITVLPFSTSTSSYDGTLTAT
jgi:hypothetical protein